MNNNIKTVDINWLYQRAKALSTSNLRKYGRSLSPCSIEHELSKCVICTIDGEAMEIDYDKYKQLYNEQKQYAEANRIR